LANRIINHSIRNAGIRPCELIAAPRGGIVRQYIRSNGAANIPSTSSNLWLFPPSVTSAFSVESPFISAKHISITPAQNLPFQQINYCTSSNSPSYHFG